jgi:hypothetical protein
LRKLRIIALTVTGLLILSAVAFAAQVNTYTVTASTSPTRAGSHRNPVPVQLSFNYTVGEASGQRPALIDKYDINFGGIVVNTTKFPGCSAATINSTQSDAACPKGSLMGTGNVENQTGSSGDPSQHSITCHLDLKVYNSGHGHAALYLHGAPNSADPAKSCPLAVDQAIDATFVKKTTGSSLVFSVDNTLLHPIAGFDNAVVQVKSTINRVTKRVKGKKIGFFQSEGGCRKGKRAVKVTFHQTDGSSQTKSAKAKCSS